MMPILLGFLLFSFIVNSLLLVPLINLLYRLRFQRQKGNNHDFLGKLTPIFNKFHAGKAGIPVGGGILTLVLTPLIFVLVFLVMYFFWLPITSVYPIAQEIKILLFTFLSFGILGFYDDAKKIFPDKNFFGLRLRHKLILELILSTLIAFWLYRDLRVDILHIPLLGVFHLGLLYIPFAAFVLTAFANAYNITDGLDGLASGLLLICLFSFWVISAGILDIPLSVFIAIWIGSLLAFLYFNVFPARIFLGDTGALSFGATLAVIGLILGKAFALIVIGGIFVIEVGSSLIQLLGKKFLRRKIFPVAPLHLWFQEKGWEEPKIVMRFWIWGVFLAIIGLFLASLI